MWSLGFAGLDNHNHQFDDIKIPLLCAYDWYAPPGIPWPDVGERRGNFCCNFHVVSQDCPNPLKWYTPLHIQKVGGVATLCPIVTTVTAVNSQDGFLAARQWSK